MNKIVDNWVDAHKDSMISDIQKAVAINSVSSTAAGPGMPFGKECRDVLDFVHGICDGFGFAFTNMDGYIGFADEGEGNETLGILTHLDIVPAGNGWSSDPFSAHIIDGDLIGRGVLDDKGPAICSIYALAAVKAAGIPFKRKVRLIFGCDEEKNMGCLKHYISHEKLPDFSFSPDAEYPLVNAEKNIFHARYSKKYPSCIKMNAGTVVNAVPSTAEAMFPVDIEVIREAIPNPDWFSIEPVHNGTKVIAQGISAHASLPEAGANAIQRMICLMKELPFPAADQEILQMLWKRFGLEYNGESANLAFSDPSGKLTLNLGLINWDESGFSVELDIRSPIHITDTILLEKLDAIFNTVGCERIRYDFSLGYCLSTDDQLVQSLLSIYRERTGDMSPPRQLGCGTYARHIKNAVAFGPERSNRINRIHMADESAPVDDLIENTKLIADAIIALACSV